MGYSIESIAAAIGAEAAGDVSCMIERAAEPAAAGPDDLAVAMSPNYASHLSEGRAKAAILWPGADWQALGLKAAIFAPRGRLAMARLTATLDPAQDFPNGIHPTAIIDPSASLADGVSVGPFSMIGPNAAIGAGTRIAGQVTIGRDVSIGADGLIFPGVRIVRNVRIGDRVVIHPNAVLGADGFSFVTATPSMVETVGKTMGTGDLIVPDDPTWYKIHSLGGVEIGDDVDIGVGTCVDAGTIRATRIGNGTKIDNHVQVGHNVILGRHCLLCAQVAIAGSTRVGDRVVMGGKAGLADNLVIGDDVVLTGATMVISNVSPGRVMMGYPATRMDQQIEIYKALRRLPRVLRDVMSRQKAVSKPDESD